MDRLKMDINKAIKYSELAQASYADFSGYSTNNVRVALQVPPCVRIDVTL
jgi:hypothetical protein